MSSRSCSGDPLAHLRDLRADPAALSSLARAAERLARPRRRRHGSGPSSRVGTGHARPRPGRRHSQPRGGRDGWPRRGHLEPRSRYRAVRPEPDRRGWARGPGPGPGGRSAAGAQRARRPGRPGWTHGSTADRLALWPAPDAGALGRALARLIPAEGPRRALRRTACGRERPAGCRRHPRRLRPARPRHRVRPPGARLPAALIADPAGFFRHPGVLGGAGGVDGGRMVALLDAARPLLGISDGPGRMAAPDRRHPHGQASAAAPRCGSACSSTRPPSGRRPPPAGSPPLLMSRCCLARARRCGRRHRARHAGRGTRTVLTREGDVPHAARASTCGPQPAPTSRCCPAERAWPGWPPPPSARRCPWCSTSWPG